MSGKWETVVNKKKGNVTKSDVKKAQQKFIKGGETIPKIEQKDPLKLERTLYETAFKNKDGDASSDEKYPSRVPLDQKASNDSSKSPRNVMKRKIKKKAQPAPIDDKIHQLDVSILKAEIKDIQGKFPGSHLIWLKDVTAWLRSQIKGPAEHSRDGFIMDEPGYPSSELSAEVHNVLKKLVKSCEKNIGSAFFVSLVSSLVSEIQKGHSSIADRVMIQILCDIYPSVILENCDEVVSGKSRNADTYMAVMWALSRPGDTPENRLKVWWTSMFSVLDKKAHGTSAIFFLRDILRSFENNKVETPVLSVEQILEVLEIIFKEKSPLNHTPSLKEELYGYYPVLKRMLFTDRPKLEAKNVFEKFFVSLKNRDEPKERDSICDLLLECLTYNSSCMDWWVDNFVHYMKESSVLLRYIKHNRPELNNQLRKSRMYCGSRPFLNAAQEMLQKLDKANERGRFEKKAGFRECRKSCVYFIETEMNRQSESSFFWTMFRFVTIVLLLLVAVDLYRANGYKGSKTSVVLKKYQIEDKLIVSYGYVKKTGQKVHGCVMETVPYYYAKVSPYVDPVMKKTGYYARVAGNAIYVHSEPLREFTNKHLPPLLEKISYFVRRQYEIISAFIVDLYAKYSPTVRKYFEFVYDWLLVSVPEAYSYISSLLIHLKRTVYDLNPEFFDKLTTILNDALDYVIRMLPIVLGQIRICLNTGVAIARNYLSQGQVWMQQQMQGATGK